MTANPPAHCCTVGFLHEGQANGEIQEIASSEFVMRYMMTATNRLVVSSYVSYPPDRSTNNAILFLTDAMGHRFINAQLIADQFAANGYFVVMPELFHGDPIPINYGAEFDIWGWYNNHLPPRVDPIVDTILGEMRTTLGCKRIGGVGYCFGGRYVCRYLKAGKLDAGFIAHPTMVQADEVEGIEGPLSIAAASESAAFLCIPLVYADRL